MKQCSFDTRSERRPYHSLLYVEGEEGKEAAEGLAALSVRDSLNARFPKTLARRPQWNQQSCQPLER